MSSPCKRLSYEKMRKVCDSLTVIEKPYQPYPNDSHWWRMKVIHIVWITES